MSKLIIEQFNFNSFSDSRGVLTAIEGNSSIPFDIKRIFYMHNVPAQEDRGGHAHRYTKQVLIACHGSVDVVCSDGVNEFSITLDDPSKGILVPEMTWTNLKNFKNDGVCIVLADSAYVMRHSIRTWAEYLKVRKLGSVRIPNSASKSTFGVNGL